MVNPFLVYAGIGIASTFFDAYSAYQRRQVSDYSSKYQMSLIKDNENFWDYYEKRTGVKPRFPYRSGAIQDYSGYYNSRYQSNTAYYNANKSGLRSVGGLGFSNSNVYYSGRYSRDRYLSLYN